MIRSLTGLRFYAALLVFISHFYLFNYCVGLTSGPVYDFLIQLGRPGVSLFFVLSGFVLFITYRAPDRKPVTTRQFYIARFARIYPLFLLTTLLALPIDILSPDHRSVISPLVLHLAMMHCFDAQACTTLNGPSWSLSTEFVFYLLFPLLSGLFIGRVFQRVGLALAVYLACVLALRLVIPESFYADAAFPPTRIGEFLLGMLAGYLYIRYNTHGAITRFCSTPQRVWLYHGFILLMMATLIFQPLLLKNHPAWQGVFYLFLAVPATLIILGLAFLEKNHKAPVLLTAPWVVWCGEISYAFYLIHHLVMRYIRNSLTHGLDWQISQIPPLTLFSIAGGIFILSLGCSYGLYKTVEMPGKKLILAYFRGKQTTPLRKPIVSLKPAD